MNRLFTPHLEMVEMNKRFSIIQVAVALGLLRILGELLAPTLLSNSQPAVATPKQ